MNWGKTILKAVLAALTFAVSYLAANPEVLTNLIPENLVNLTIGGAVAAGLVALSNWLKHRND